MKNKFTYLAVAVLALAGFMLAAYGLRSHSRAKARAEFAAGLRELEARATENASHLTAEPLLAGTNDREQLFAVRKAYDQFDPHATVDSGTLAQLKVLGEGLASGNEVVRETTGDIIRHVLTAWVRGRSDARAYPEINAFFKYYQHVGSRKLNEFLRNFPDSPEADYLKQI